LAQLASSHRPYHREDNLLSQRATATTATTITSYTTHPCNTSNSIFSPQSSMTPLLATRLRSAAKQRCKLELLRNNGGSEPKPLFPVHHTSVAIASAIFTIYAAKAVIFVATVAQMVLLAVSANTDFLLVPNTFSVALPLRPLPPPLLAAPPESPLSRSPLSYFAHHLPTPPPWSRFLSSDPDFLIPGPNADPANILTLVIPGGQVFLNMIYCNTHAFTLLLDPCSSTVSFNIMILHEKHLDLLRILSSSNMNNLRHNSACKGTSW
jgi:hypothetical protein